MSGGVPVLSPSFGMGRVDHSHCSPSSRNSIHSRVTVREHALSHCSSFHSFATRMERHMEIGAALSPFAPC